MESRAHAIVAGLFTLLLGIGVVLAALWFSRESYDHVSYVLESKYAVTGLNPQAPVKLRGVQIGKVNSIDFDTEDVNAILVTIVIKAGSRITRGTTAQLGAQGITGTSYVNLEDEGKNPEFLPPATDKASRIPVKRSLFDEFAMSGQEILFEINRMAKLAQDLLSEPNQTQLVNMLKSVQGASERMNKLAQALEPGAKSIPALAGDARKLLAGAGDTVRDVAPVLQDARTALASIDKLAREYAQRADALDRVGRNADEVGSASQSVTGAAGAMAGDVVPRMNALLEELVRNSRNLDRLLADLNEQPQGLVFGRPARKPGPGESGYAEAQKK
jgi:phospholipid/cholesterol/gamma-HCH transport system substrate-binding protein